MTARVEAERAIAAKLAEHDGLRSHGPGTGWFCRGCGQKMTDWPTPEECRPHESAMEVVHRAHVASVLADLMVERQAEAWDEGVGYMAERWGDAVRSISQLPTRPKPAPTRPEGHTR